LRSSASSRNKPTLRVAYIAAGVLRQVEAVLAPESSVTAFMRHHSIDLWRTWEFACRFHLEYLVRSVESRMMQSPKQALNEMAKGSGSPASLPSSSAHTACGSLFRLLEVTYKRSDRWEAVAKALFGVIKEHTTGLPGPLAGSWLEKCDLDLRANKIMRGET
jgi:hypothetical protein